FVEVAYFTQQNGQKALGQLKVMSFASDEVPLLCTLDEPGYVKTFERVASGLASSMQKASAAAAPAYREIQIIKLGEQPLGFQRDEYAKTKDGGMAQASSSTMFLTIGKTTIRSLDTGGAIVLDKAGRISERRYVRVENGEIALQVILKRENGNDYTVQGKQKGAPLSAKFSTKDKAGLPGDPLIAQLTKAYLKGKAKELKVEQFSPSESLTAVTEATLRRDSSRTNGVEITIGQLTVHGTVDEAGATDEVNAQLGENQITQKRIFKEGALPTYGK
ncbi:MAG: hypothetical protein ACJ790_04565, partial [Myxococcaceae bacterium]